MLSTCVRRFGVPSFLINNSHFSLRLRNQQQSSNLSPDASDLSMGNRLSSFHKKSTAELIRSYAVLMASSQAIIAKNSERLIRLGPRILGKSLFNSLMRHTFYNQFVCGESHESIKKTGLELRSKNLHMFILMVEEVGLDEADKVPFDENALKFIGLIKLAKEIGNQTACQVRPSAFIKPSSLVTVSSTLERLASADKTELYHLVSASMVDASKDSELSAFLVKENALPRHEIQEFCGALRALGRLAKAATENQVRLLVDGELDRMNPALLMATVGMMQIANKDRALIYGTYQAYLKKTESRLNFDLEFCRRNDRKFALKLVRGAYMDSERALAHAEGASEAPVWETYALTNKNYDKLLLQLLECFSKSDAGSVVAATHNWTTISEVLKNHEAVFLRSPDRAMFGQTWGFTDYISELLASRGYFVYQSVAHGSTAAALPFLARRAQENFCMIQRTNVDKMAIKIELKRRVLRSA